MKGGADAVLQYADDYEIVVVDAPKLSTRDLYNDMFGVSAYTSNLSRSMQIVTYLNTNEDFRNLILYGIEGENYELLKSDLKDDNGEIYPLVKLLNEDYQMAIEKTGNTLIAYPLEDEVANRVEYYSTQNQAAKVDLHMCFDLDYNDYKINVETMQNIRTLSAKVYEELMACSYAELEAKIASLAAEVSANADVIFHASIENGNTDAEGNVDDEKLCSFTFVYFKWLEDLKIYVPPVVEEEPAA